MADGNVNNSLMTRSAIIDWLIDQASGANLELASGATLFEANITPEVARAVLRFTNSHNPRKLMRPVAERYGKDISSNSWWDSFAPVVFEGDEFALVDGQHRLQGVIHAGVAQRFLVVIYASEDAKRGIDIHKTRGITATHGLQNHAAAAARLIIHLELGDLRQATREEVARKVAEYEGTIERATTQGRRRRISGRASFGAAFAIALRHASNDDAILVGELLEDIVSMAQFSDAARAIATLLERDEVRTGVPTRCDETLKILQGIVSHLEQKPLKILRPSTAGLRWFLPLSKYRVSSISPQLGGPPRRQRQEGDGEE